MSSTQRKHVFIWVNSFSAWNVLNPDQVVCMDYWKVGPKCNLNKNYSLGYDKITDAYVKGAFPLWLLSNSTADKYEVVNSSSSWQQFFLSKECWQVKYQHMEYEVWISRLINIYVSLYQYNLYRERQR